jgi:hypothetical protein
LQHEKGTTPANEGGIKHLDQSHSGKGELTSHETSPKRNTATTEEKPSISQRGCAAVEGISDWPWSISVSQPTELYAQMTPPVNNSNLRKKLRSQG